MMNFDERFDGVRRTRRLRRYAYQMSKVFQRIFPSPVLTRERVRLALAVAVATDVLQLALGPFGWAFADELLDVAAMTLTWRLIGFHPLLPADLRPGVLAACGYAADVDGQCG